MQDILVTRENASENELHCYHTEASDLGLPPGHWPNAINTTLGNGQPFIRSPEKGNVEHGEMAWIRYVQANGCLELRIFND